MHEDQDEPRLWIAPRDFSAAVGEAALAAAQATAELAMRISPTLLPDVFWCDQHGTAHQGAPDDFTPAHGRSLHAVYISQGAVIGTRSGPRGNAVVWYYAKRGDKIHAVEHVSEAGDTEDERTSDVAMCGAQRSYRKAWRDDESDVCSTCTLLVEEWSAGG